MSDALTLERGVATSRPVELYEFDGRDARFLYTSAEDELTIGGKDYAPCPGLMRSGISRSADDRMRTLSVSMASNDPLVATLAPTPRPYEVLVKILRVQRDDPTLEAKPIFNGHVRGATFDQDGGRAVIACAPITDYASRAMPRFYFQSVCAHRLYDARCKATKFNHQMVGPCTAKFESPSGITITVTGVSASGMDFVGGFATILGTGDPRMVIKQGSILTGDEDDLVLLGPFFDDPVGQDIEVQEGCDRLMNGDCGSKFDRVISFGGFAWVPTKNVFVNGLY